MCLPRAGRLLPPLGSVGDVIVASVKSATPGGAVKKGDVVQGRHRAHEEQYRRVDGTYIRFDDNAAVIINGPEAAPAAPASLGPWRVSSARRTI